MDRDPPSGSIAVEVEDPRWLELEPGAEALAAEAAQAALAEAGGPNGEIAILLTDDAAVRALNDRFRGKDAATNVLSFPAAASAMGCLGDLALAFGVCEREARERGGPLAWRLQHLVAHGVLHLIGHDHQDDEEAEAMEALERRVMARLGAPDPYALDAALEGRSGG